MWIENRPKKGRGEIRKIEAHLGIHSTFVSHILKGDKNFSEEQALHLSEYLCLEEIEIDYFLELVRFSRAGSYKLQSRIETNLKKLREEALKIKRIVGSSKTLSSEQAAIFYSEWYYSATRLLCDLPLVNTDLDIAKILKLEINMVQKILEFLIKNGLVSQVEDRLSLGPSKTHLDRDSELLPVMQKNWRIKGMEQRYQKQEETLFFTAPFTCSKKDQKKIRLKFLELIKDLNTRVENSPSEKLLCLNIDLFEV